MWEVYALLKIIADKQLFADRFNTKIESLIFQL